jgi:hypothetical protein
VVAGGVQSGDAKRAKIVWRHRDESAHSLDSVPPRNISVISSHLISSHLISSHLISSHLISFHSLPSVGGHHARQLHASVDRVGHSARLQLLSEQTGLLRRRAGRQSGLWQNFDSHSDCIGVWGIASTGAQINVLCAGFSGVFESSIIIQLRTEKSYRLFFKYFSAVFMTFAPSTTFRPSGEGQGGQVRRLRGRVGARARRSIPRGAGRERLVGSGVKGQSLCSLLNR